MVYTAQYFIKIVGYKNSSIIMFFESKILVILFLLSNHIKLVRSENTGLIPFV